MAGLSRVLATFRCAAPADVRTWQKTGGSSEPERLSNDDFTPSSWSPGGHEFLARRRGHD
jgi:hypothetical protein